MRLLGQRLLVAVHDDGRGGAQESAGTGLAGLADRVTAVGGTLRVDSPPGAGTRLEATIPLAPWRTAREPFLEFGHEDDGGLGDSLLEMVLDGRKTVSVALAREWDLEGGPPRPGQRIPVLDAAGTRRAIVEVVRVTVVPFADVDADVVEASQAGVATVGRVARDAARVLRGLPRRGRAAARRARLAPHRRRADGRHLVHAGRVG